MSHLSNIPEEYQKEVYERRRISDLKGNLSKNAAVLSFIVSPENKVMVITCTNHARMDFEFRNTADILEVSNIDFSVSRPENEIRIDKKFYDKVIKFKVINNYNDLDRLKRRTKVIYTL